MYTDSGIVAIEMHSCVPGGVKSIERSRSMISLWPKRWLQKQLCILIVY